MSIRFDPVEAAKTLPVIAWVQIQAAAPIAGAQGGSCGARYTGRVVSAIRGAEEGQLLTFGYFLGRQVGQQFIVFLASKPLITPNIGRMPQGVLRDPQCLSVLPELVEVAEGLGTIKVSNTSRGSEVTLDSMFHVVPIDLVPADQRAAKVYDGHFQGAVALPATAFSAYIRNLSR